MFIPYIQDIDIQDIERQVQKQAESLQNKKDSKKPYQIKNISSDLRQGFNNDQRAIGKESEEEAQKRIAAYYELAEIREKGGDKQSAAYLRDQADKLNKAFMKAQDPTLMIDAKFMTETSNQINKK